MDKEQMQTRLEICEREQAQMKAVNAYYRKHGTIIGGSTLSKEDTIALDEAVRHRYDVDSKEHKERLLRQSAGPVIII